MNTAPHNHRLQIQDQFHDLVIQRMAAPLQALHSFNGQGFLVGGVRHMTAEKAYNVLRGIDREPCGAVHHMVMPRGSSGRCNNATQQNTLGCAHGSQLGLQQALVAAALLKVIDEGALREYAAIRMTQKNTLLDADNLLTKGYAIAARGKDDDASKDHLRRMGLPVVNVEPKDVHDWMCGKQEATSAPIAAIMDKVIAGLQERFPELLEAAA